jgi:hypothetical protein
MRSYERYVDFRSRCRNRCRTRQPHEREDHDLPLADSRGWNPTSALARWRERLTVPVAIDRIIAPGAGAKSPLCAVTWFIQKLEHRVKKLLPFWVLAADKLALDQLTAMFAKVNDGGDFLRRH